MIRTKRLFLRPFNIEKDLFFLRHCLADKRMMKYVLGLPDVNDVCSWVKAPGQIKLVVVNIEEGAICPKIGMAVLTPFSTTIEIGGWLGHAYQGKGYAKEALKGIEDWLREQGYHKMTATVLQGNGGIKSAMWHLGFNLLAVLKEHATINKKLVNLDIYEKFLRRENESY